MEFCNVDVNQIYHGEGLKLVSSKDNLSAIVISSNMFTADNDLYKSQCEISHSFPGAYFSRNDTRGLEGCIIDSAPLNPISSEDEGRFKLLLSVFTLGSPFCHSSPCYNPPK
ncbi:hypothetical protein CEXT_406371 [Caerostris extrusa]|uniref:Uncharacterized protein n=1 Tax=Caerostris extrusa TaxID=172846 RepID=A0AAV4QLP3_CAEEX|nr:hypothetical protein CEXT_406371 [Caerostris extrusa]